LRRISTVDLVNYRRHLIRSEKLRAASVNRKVQALKKLLAGLSTRNSSPPIPPLPCGFSAARSGHSPKVSAKKRSRRCCGRRGRPATGWRAAIMPSATAPANRPARGGGLSAGDRRLRDQ
jgi:hypothetical protein